MANLEEIEVDAMDVDDFTDGGDSESMITSEDEASDDKNEDSHAQPATRRLGRRVGSKNKAGHKAGGARDGAGRPELDKPETKRRKKFNTEVEINQVLSNPVRPGTTSAPPAPLFTPGYRPPETLHQQQVREAAANLRSGTLPSLRKADQPTGTSTSAIPSKPITASTSVSASPSTPATVLPSTSSNTTASISSAPAPATNSEPFASTANSTYGSSSSFQNSPSRVLVDEPTLSETFQNDPDEGSSAAYEREGIPEDAIEDPFLKGVIGQVKDQMDQRGKPDIYERGSFKIEARSPFFVAQQAMKVGLFDRARDELGAAEIARALDVFVWIPKACIGVEKLRCSECKGILQGNGYSVRRVHNTPRSYWLLGQRHLCPQKTHGQHTIKTSKSFMSWSPEILRQLPKRLLREFPAFLSHRGAIDKNLLRIVRSNLSDGIGTEAISDMLLRNAALEYDNRQLIWAQSLKDLPTRNWPTGDLAFPPFDPASVATRWYLRDIFIDFSTSIRAYLDHAISTLSALMMRWDHHFKLPKLLGKLRGTTSFEALFTIMNEYEQIRFQAFVPTKSFDHLGPYFQGILGDLNATGQPAPIYGYTDNPGAEFHFLEALVHTFRDDVVHPKTNRPSLPPLKLPDNFQIRVESSQSQIDLLCQPLLDGLLEDESKFYYVGFDMEWDYVKGEKEKPVALIQLAVQELKTVFLFRVHSFRSLDAAPQSLITLLQHHRFVKVGRNVLGDLKKLKRDWDLTVLPPSPLCGYLDLQDLAISKGFQDAASSVAKVEHSLENYCKVILGASLDKGKRLSLWSRGEGGNGALSFEQIAYAWGDAVAGLLIYQKLSLLPTINLPVPPSLPTNTSLPVAITTGELCRVVARGFVDSPQPTNFIAFPNPAVKIVDRKKLLVVRVTEVLAPSFKLSQHSSSTLGQLEERRAAEQAASFSVLIGVKAVRTRSTTPPFTLPLDDLEDPEDDDEQNEVMEDGDAGVKAKGKAAKAKGAKKRVLKAHDSDDGFSDEDASWSSDESKSEASDLDSEDENEAIFNLVVPREKKSELSVAPSSTDLSEKSADSSGEVELLPDRPVQVLDPEMQNLSSNPTPDPLNELNASLVPSSSLPAQESEPNISALPTSTSQMPPQMTTSEMNTSTSTSSSVEGSLSSTNQSPTLPSVKVSPLADETNTPRYRVLHSMRQSSGSQSLPTRIGYDIFHAIDKVTKTLSKKHSLFEYFCGILSQILLVPVDTDKRRVEDFFESENKKHAGEKGWVKYDWERVRKKGDGWLWARVRRIGPSGKRSSHDLREMAAQLGDVVCSKTGRKLFTPETWIKIESLISDAENGWLADPPNISLYTVRGVDRDGLTLYHCLRGSSSVEGLHKNLRRLYRANQGSPELADHSIAWSRHETNIKAGARHKLGRQHKWHFDSWEGDQIDELYEELHLCCPRTTRLLRHPTPVDGSRTNDTSALPLGSLTETYGFTSIPLDLCQQYGFASSIVPRQDRTPSDLLLSHLRTTRTSPYTFLASCQGTAVAVTPIHTTAEIGLFYELAKNPLCLDGGGKVSAEKMARVWSTYVMVGNKDNKIFYKLVQHINKFLRVYDRAQSRKQTLLRIEAATSAFTKKIKNPNRVGSALPARELESSASTSSAILPHQPRRAPNKKSDAAKAPVIPFIAPNSGAVFIPLHSRPPLPPPPPQLSESVTHPTSSSTIVIPPLVARAVESTTSSSIPRSITASEKEKAPRGRRCRVCVFAKVSDVLAFKCIGSKNRPSCPYFAMYGDAMAAAPTSREIRKPAVKKPKLSH